MGGGIVAPSGFIIRLDADSYDGLLHLDVP